MVQATDLMTWYQHWFNMTSMSLRRSKKGNKTTNMELVLTACLHLGDLDLNLKHPFLFLNGLFSVDV